MVSGLTQVLLSDAGCVVKVSSDFILKRLFFSIGHRFEAPVIVLYRHTEQITSI